MKTYVFDIESDNLLDKITKIHCVVVQDFNTKEIFSYGPSDIQRGLSKLKEADRLVGHNIIGFDIPAIKKLYPEWDTQCELVDTLTASKIIWPDIFSMDMILLNKGKMNRKMLGKYSLEAFGYRLGELKGEFGKQENAWDIYTPEMLTYCEQDVNVCSKLYFKLLEKQLDFGVLNLEQEVRKICLQQTQFGFNFDVPKALKLEEILERKRIALTIDIDKELGGCFITPLDVVHPQKSMKYKDPTRGNITQGASYTKVKFTDFNATSRLHLGKRLIERCGWKPKKMNEDGTPTLDDEVLKTLKFPIAEKVSELFTIQKRLGMLSDGQQAWLKLVEPDGKIRGQVDTIGAGTARATHSKPNLAQIPSNSAIFGKECRELFTAPTGWKLFGTDVAGLELRVLAHYMSAWDKGAYGRIILEGDIHTTNQIAAGLPTRASAKEFIYAFLYGAGDALIGDLINGKAKEGKKIKEKFFSEIPALKNLKDKVEQAAELRKQVKTIDGRFIPVRSTHSALNFLLQSAGAIICKHWLVNFNKILVSEGYITGVHFNQVAWVHDELQVAFNPQLITEEKLAEASRKAIKMAEETLKLKIPLDISYAVGDNYSQTH